MAALKTSIGKHDAKSVTLRGKDLVNELLGHCSYTEVFYLLVCGRMPTQGEVRILDACLITLMDHGMTPHAIVTRLVGDCNPDDAQTAIAAGLLCVGDVFAGTMDGCAKILEEGIRSGAEPGSYCKDVVAQHRNARRSVPGLGHPIHKPDDPRSPRLFEIARANGANGRYIELLQLLAAAAEEAYGRHLTINATGAIAALLLEIGLPVSAMRGVAVTSRCGGLVAQLAESRPQKGGMAIHALVEEAFD